jgi:Xaa-Pro aminopeptidase
MEYEVMAEVLHEFRSHNADISYYPIVGGGANACVMHYRDNDKPLRDGDLLLLDAGCEHEYYASDITRTFPIGGRFTPAQRAVYEVGARARSSRPSTKCAPATTGTSRMRRRCAKSRTAWSSSVCSKAAGAAHQGAAYMEFFNHRTGHWLGSTCTTSATTKSAGNGACSKRHGADRRAGHLHPPVAEDPKEFWNIGVRIEDDVLVTADGRKCSRELEKDPDAIERLVQAA